MNNTNKNILNNKNNPKFPYVIINVLYLLLFIASVIIFYFVYLRIKKLYATSTANFTQNKILNKRDGKSQMQVSNTLTPISLYGNEFNISFWIKILDYSYKLGSIKHILNKGGIQIYLAPKHSDMHIIVDGIDVSTAEETATARSESSENFKSLLNNVNKNTNIKSIDQFEDDKLLLNNEQLNDKDALKDDNAKLETECIDNSNICNNEVKYKHNWLLDLVSCQNYDVNELFNDNVLEEEEERESPKTNDKCIFHNLPLQKWNHVSINFVGPMVEVYLDGKLSKSCELNIISHYNINNITLLPFGGFGGEIANFYYSNIRLSTRQIRNLYKEGPN